MLKAGCEIILAPNDNKKVIAKINRHLPHIVFLEDCGKQCDAVEIIKKIQKCSALPLFMVITPSVSVECKLQDIGTDYVFLKPIDWLVMAERIKRIAKAIAEKEEMKS